MVKTHLPCSVFIGYILSKIISGPYIAAFIIYVIETICAWAKVVMRGRHDDVVSTAMGAGTSDVAMYLWGANRRRCNGVPPLPNVCQTFVRFRRKTMRYLIPYLQTISATTPQLDSDRGTTVIFPQDDDRYVV